MKRWMAAQVVVLCGLVGIAAAQPRGAQPRKVVLQPLTTQTGVTASTTGETTFGLSFVQNMMCVLDVTAISGTGAVFRVELLGSPDEGQTFDAVAQFADAVLADGVHKRVGFYNVNSALTPIGAFGHKPRAIGGTALTGGNAENVVFGDRLRVQWSLAGTTPAATFSVTCFVTE